MLARVATWLAGLLLAWWALVAVLWMIGLHLIVPRLDQWRGPMQSLASWALGVPVQVQRVVANTEAVLPELVLQQVVLGQGAGAPRAAEIRIRASWWSLLRLELAAVEVRAPELTLQRKNQAWSVLGLALPAPAAPTTTASPWLAWLLARPLVGVQDGVVRWRQIGANGQVVDQGQFNAVSVRLSQQGRRLTLSAQAQPQDQLDAQWQLQFDGRQPLWPGDATQWQAWSGQLYWQVQGLDWARWRDRLGGWALDARVPVQAVGNGRGWAELSRGQWRSLTTDLALRNVRFAANGAAVGLALPQLQARLSWQPGEAGGWTLRSQGLAFTWGEQQRWPGGDLEVGWRPAGAQAPAQLTLAGQRLELAALLALAKPLGLDTALPSTWREAGLSGLLPRLSLRWQGNGEQQAADWQLQADFDGLTWQASAQPWRPGVVGLSGSVQASAQRVALRLQTRQATLSLPGVWPRALPFDAMSGEVVGQPQPDGRWQIQTTGLNWSVLGSQGTWAGQWLGQPGQWGEVDLALRNGELDLPALMPWLPPAWTQAQPLAGVAGRLTDVQSTVKGALPAVFDLTAAFNGDNGWRGRAKVDQVDWPASKAGAWPGLAEVHGQLAWQPQRVSLTQAKAQLAESPRAQLTQLEAVWDGRGREPQVSLALRAAGPLQAWLQVAQRSAASQAVGHALSQIQAGGQVQASLQVQGPWQRLAQAPWRGDVSLEQATLAWRNDLPPLEQLSGHLRLEGTAWRARDVKAQWLGGAVAGEVEYAPGGAWRVQLQGAAQVQRLLAIEALAPAHTLLKHMQGVLPFALQWQRTAQASNWRLDSSLQGVALTVPAPFTKTADSRWPLQIEVTQSDDQPLVQLRLEAPTAPVAARVRLQARAGAWHPVSGAWAVGAPLPDTRADAKPLRGVLQLSDLSVDAWNDWMVRGVLQNTLGTGSALSPDWWPGQWQVQVERLQVQGTVLTQLSGQAQRVGNNGWRGVIDATQVKGQWQWQPASGKQAARLRGNFDRLWLPKPREGATNWSQQLRDDLPDADVVVQSLKIGSRDLGRLELVAKPQAQQPQRWQISKLWLQTADADLRASGYWQTPAADASANSPQRTALKFGLRIANAGALLARFDMPGVLRDGAGNLQGELSWAGAPFDFQQVSLSGEMELNLAKGQFLRADPGIAKLLGVLSLQTLPRRLLLDFRDVFDKGFAFDQTRGKARVTQGVIRTNNFTMQGVSASVFMEGELNLLRETQQLRVLVSPDVDTTAVSLLTATANPVVGLVSFLLQRSVGSVINAQGMRAFEVSGSWDNPQVENVALRRNDGKAPVEVLEPQNRKAPVDGLVPRPSTPVRQ